MSSTAVAGVDLGGTKIEVGIFGEDNAPLGSARHPTPSSGGPEDVAAAIVIAAHEACEQAGVAPGDLAGIGVGSPGVVDPHTGTVSGARNLPDWEGSFPLGDVLTEKLGVRVAVGNDVAVATDAEFELGAGKAYHSILGVFWGTGVGGGIILDDVPWHGRGAAGEIGHTVVKMGGRQCACGRKGCMEAYAGRGALEARARKRHADGEDTELFKIMEKRGRSRLTSAVWAKALEARDKLATALIDEAVGALGAGIGSAVNLLDIEAVVIGGGLGVRFGEPMTRRIEQAMLPHVFNSASPPEVHLASLGDLGGALGASLLVRRAVAAA